MNAVDGESRIDNSSALYSLTQLKNAVHFARQIARSVSQYLCEKKENT